MPIKLTPEQIAKVAHEANRAYCQTLGDHSGLPWADTPRDQKDSVISGVKTIQADPSTTPAQSHLKWTAYKAKQGWTSGPKKDAILKTHPCLVPYSMMPPEQQLKDILFGTIVRIMDPSIPSIWPASAGPHEVKEPEMEPTTPTAQVPCCEIRDESPQMEPAQEPAKEPKQAPDCDCADAPEPPPEELPEGGNSEPEQPPDKNPPAASPAA